jgi:hypothetical protein
VTILAVVLGLMVAGGVGAWYEIGRRRRAAEKGEPSDDGGMSEGLMMQTIESNAAVQPEMDQDTF